MRWLLNTVSFVALLAIGLMFLWSANRSSAGGSREEGAIPSEPVTLAGAEIDGSATATDVVMVFSDFQCPYCGKFARQTMPRLRERYVRTGRVLLAFRNLPLTTIHQFARTAAQAAICVGREGRFWDMHNSLFENQAQLAEPALRERAMRFGLTQQRFDACLADDVIGNELEDDASLARRLGVKSVPTVMVGRLRSDGQVDVTRRFSGVASLDEIGEAIASGHVGKQE